MEPYPLARSTSASSCPTSPNDTPRPRLAHRTYSGIAPNSRASSNGGFSAASLGNTQLFYFSQSPPSSSQSTSLAAGPPHTPISASIPLRTKSTSSCSSDSSRARSSSINRGSDRKGSSLGRQRSCASSFDTSSSEGEEARPRKHTLMSMPSIETSSNRSTALGFFTCPPVPRRTSGTIGDFVIDGEEDYLLYLDIIGAAGMVPEAHVALQSSNAAGGASSSSSSSNYRELPVALHPSWSSYRRSRSLSGHTAEVDGSDEETEQEREVEDGQAEAGDSWSSRSAPATSPSLTYSPSSSKSSTASSYFSYGPSSPCMSTKPPATDVVPASAPLPAQLSKLPKLSEPSIPTSPVQQHQ